MPGETEIVLFMSKGNSDTSGCTRPPQSQSGALFCHLNYPFVVFKSVRQFFGEKSSERYDKYASNYEFGTSLADKLA